jgi:hypothetical protein
MAVGTRCADHVTPSTRKSRHYFAESGGRSVGIVRLRTEFSFLVVSPEYSCTLQLCGILVWSTSTYNLEPNRMGHPCCNLSTKQQWEAKPRGGDQWLSSFLYFVLMRISWVLNSVLLGNYTRSCASSVPPPPHRKLLLMYFGASLSSTVTRNMAVLRVLTAPARLYNRILKSVACLFCSCGPYKRRYAAQRTSVIVNKFGSVGTA